MKKVEFYYDETNGKVVAKNALTGEVVDLIVDVERSPYYGFLKVVEKPILHADLNHQENI